SGGATVPGACGRHRLPHRDRLLRRRLLLRARRCADPLARARLRTLRLRGPAHRLHRRDLLSDLRLWTTTKSEGTTRVDPSHSFTVGVARLDPAGLGPGSAPPHATAARPREGSATPSPVQPPPPAPLRCPDSPPPSLRESYPTHHPGRPSTRRSTRPRRRGES